MRKHEMKSPVAGQEQEAGSFKHGNEVCFAKCG